MSSKRKWSTLFPAILGEAWLPSGITGAYAFLLYCGGVSPTDFVVFWGFCGSTVLWALVAGMLEWRLSKTFPIADTKKAWVLVWRRSPCSFFEKCLVRVFYLGIRWCSPDGSAKLHWKMFLRMSFVALLTVLFLWGGLSLALDNGYEKWVDVLIIYAFLRLLVLALVGGDMEKN